MLASKGALIAFSFFAEGYRLPAELEIVGSSLPDPPETFTSSLVAYSASTTSLASAAAGGVSLLVIQSSLIDIKLIIVSIRSD